jgi:CRP-like cAMP-binding protein
LIIHTHTELRNISQDDWNGLLDLGNDKFYPAGSVIFSQGDEVKYFYVLKSGFVKCARLFENGESEKIFSITRAYTFLCAAANICHVEKYPVSEVAYTDTVVTCINWDHAFAFFSGKPDFIFCLLKCLSGELLGTYNQSADVYLNVKQRVTRFLLLQDSYGMVCYHDYFKENEICISHETLASILGASRPTVSLALQELEDLHLIKKEYKKIIILSRNKLEKYCNLINTTLDN